MRSEEVNSYYGYEYFHGGDYHNYVSSELIIKRNFQENIRRLLEIKPDGKLLEVGCAYGFFLDLAADYWAVSGIDISAIAIEFCKKRHPNYVDQGDLLAVDLPISTFDWVVAWDVIEHVDDPIQYSARIYDLLDEGGKIALTTGDISSTMAKLLGKRWRLLTPPSHLTFFSREGMASLLIKAGFNQIQFSTLGYERSLDFTLFRLIGQKQYARLCKLFPSLCAKFESISFRVDLKDIMFVTATKVDTRKIKR
jgi:SAM-dependent methyltransferase